MNKITYLFDGVEYTTRSRVIREMDILAPTLQWLLDAHPELQPIKEDNKYFYVKADIEKLITEFHANRKKK